MSMRCRHCDALVSLPLADLGTSPPSNAYLSTAALHEPERWYPLRVLVCERCWLVQTEDFAQAHELFDANYAYFSSFSSSWLDHARRYANTMRDRFGLEKTSHVVEIASNDGYLLQYVAELGIPCLGVEPTASTAAAARDKGLQVVESFFGRELALELHGQGHAADLMVANNVLAHVPDINDFVVGFSILLKPAGVATFEFPHVLQLVQQAQFDTLYHEHFSYLSLTAVQRIFVENGLQIFDVQELFTHGGSLRIFAQRSDSPTPFKTEAAVSFMQEREDLAGIRSSDFYRNFQAQALRIKDELLTFLLQAKFNGQKVVAYGAAAKGNTLLNFAGVRADMLAYVVDKNPSKQGFYMPGSRIPIVDESRLREDRPDIVIILPWNLKDEIVTQLDYVREWGGRFAVAVPALKILENMPI